MAGHKITVREPNGSLTERTMQEALAELGARVLIVLNIKTPEDRDGYIDGQSAQAVLRHIIGEADALGLLDTIGPRDQSPDQREVGS